MAATKESVRKKPATKKPNGASVTARPCTCKYLERAADETDGPIVFDAKVNEYHIRTNRGGSRVIYHCPWCGGAAPPSKRASLFATISSDEAKRLNELASGLRTIDEVIARFGKPDEDHEHGLTVHKPASDTEPPKVVSYRLLRYKQLSTTADVELVDHGPERGIHVALYGKYIGSNT